jgi:hypothetical protein
MTVRGESEGLRGVVCRRRRLGAARPRPAFVGDCDGRVDVRGKAREEAIEEFFVGEDVVSEPVISRDESWFMERAGREDAGVCRFRRGVICPGALRLIGGQGWNPVFLAA